MVAGNQNDDHTIQTTQIGNAQWATSSVLGGASRPPEPPLAPAAGQRLRRAPLARTTTPPSCGEGGGGDDDGGGSDIGGGDGGAYDDGSVEHEDEEVPEGDSYGQRWPCPTDTSKHRHGSTAATSQVDTDTAEMVNEREGGAH